MNRVTMDNLRSQIDQADAAFRDLMADWSTEELAETLQAFSAAAAHCPASTIMAMIADFGPLEACQIITHSVSRMIGELLLARWEAEENDGT